VRPAHGIAVRLGALLIAVAFLACGDEPRAAPAISPGEASGWAQEAATPVASKRKKRKRKVKRKRRKAKTKRSRRKIKRSRRKHRAKQLRRRAKARHAKPRPKSQGSLTKKARPSDPSCGVRGKPPCRTSPNPGSADRTAPPPDCGTGTSRVCPPSPPPPGCGSAGGPPCNRPDKPRIIAVPLPPLPPGDDRFTPRYLSSLPRLSEGARARSSPALPAASPANQVLVLVDQAQPATLEDDLAQQYQLRRVSGQNLTLLAARAQLYDIPDSRTVATVVAALSADTRVRLAQNNFRYFRQGEAGETVATASLQYALAKSSIVPAHELAQGRGVLIAVIDSTIDSAHRDLKGVVVGTFDAAGPGKSDGHGTAIAGIIAGQGSVRGVAPMARILAVRAFTVSDRQEPAASSSAILLKAIEWSVLNGAQVLNMSFVGPRDPAVRAVVEAAQERNAVLVAAAGNGGPKAPPAYPAAYPGVVAVTAVDADDHRYPHANRGGYIAVAAPGVEIFAPADGDKYTYVSGTSFAAAHVSGIIALLLEHRRTIRHQNVFAALTQSAVDLGPPGRDEDFGFGRANALAALQGLGASK